VKQVAESWWADFETRGASSGTMRLYRGRLDTVILPALGELRVRELTVATIHRHLQTVTRTNGAGTARTCRAILSGICAFAAQRDALDRNPVRDAGPARQIVPKRLPTSLSTVQARQLRALLTYDDVAIAHDVPDLVGFMLATGARIGEACALTWDAVDLETGIVKIRGTKTAAAVRIVRLPSWCVDMLRCRFEIVNQSNALVFPTSTGTLRDPSNVQKRLKEAFERAGFEGTTSHALRKTAATLLDQLDSAPGRSPTSSATPVRLSRRMCTWAVEWHRSALPWCSTAWPNSGGRRPLPKSFAMASARLLKFAER
jgi:integrase